MNRLKLARNGYIAISIIFYIAGVCAIAWPDLAARTPVCLISGGVLLLYGAIKMLGFFSKDLYCLAFQYDLAFGLLTVVLGLVVLLWGRRVLPYLSPGLGVLALTDSFFRLQMSGDAKRFGLNEWRIILILALLTGLFSLLLLVSSFHGLRSVRWLAGGTLLLEGLMNQCVVLYTVKFRKSPPGSAE